METIQSFITFFSEKDGNKRITFFKSFLELAIILLYSIFSYKSLYGNFGLIEPNDYKGLYQFFITGNLFICGLIFSFWFIVVRNIPYVVLYGIDSLILWSFRGVIRKLRINAFDFLLELNALTVEDGRYKIGKRFNLIENIFKHFYNESEDNLLEILFHNISLMVQFAIILLVFVSHQIHIPLVVQIVVWFILIYSFLNQIVVFMLIKMIDDYGYKILEAIEGFKRYGYSHKSDSTAFDSDKPIFLKEQNLLLNRDYFSNILTEAINGYEGKEGLVIGIDAEWGDGKTSFVNMTLQKFIYPAMERSFFPIENSKKKYVLFFNPWNFSNSKGLTLHFLNELKRNIRKILGNKYSEDLNNKLLLYFNYITNGGFQTPQNLIDQENDTESLKKEVDSILRNIDFKLIIVIDDLDRLVSSEILQVFRFVKIVGDFPNIIYIIPFDKAKTLLTCKIEEEYLEKIIQIQIKLPPVLQSEINIVLTDRINTLLESYEIKSFNSDDLGKALRGSLKSYVRNLRDIGRVINSLKFYLSNSSVRELNINDFVILTIIQIFDIRLYNFIGANKTLFSYSDKSGYSSMYKGNFDLKTEYKELLKSVEKKFNIGSEEFYGLIFNLFPNLSTLKDSLDFSGRNSNSNRKDHRINSSIYFDKYFLYPLNLDKLSKEEIESVLLISERLEQFVNSIARLIKDGNYDFFIERFEDYLEDPRILKNKENIISGFLLLGSKIPDENSSGSSNIFTPKTTTTYIINRIVQGFSLEERVSFYKKIFKNKKNDIDILTDLYGRFADELGLKGELFVNLEYIKKNYSEQSEQFSLYNSVLKRVRKSFGQIINASNSIYLLHFWKKLDSQNKYIEIILEKHLNKNDSNFISFFYKALEIVEVQDSQYGLHSREIYHIDNMKKYIDVEFVNKKLQDIENKISIDDNFWIEYPSFWHYKTVFEDCLSGKIDYHNKRWYRPSMINL